MTPPATPSSIPAMVTMRFPNLLARGTTKAAAAAMGIAPKIASRDWAAP